MELKPSYKQSEVGVIPSDWEVKELKEVSIITRLAGYEYSTLWKEDENGEIIALRGFNIGKNKIIERDFVRISNKLSQILNRSRLYKNDIVYPCVGTIGNAVVIEENNKYHIQQNIAKISPKENEIKSNFLAYFLMSSYGLNEIQKFNGSSSQPNILVSSLRKYSIVLPTLAEQTAIATALSDTDAYIAHLEKLIAKKRAIKQGAMQELLKPKEGWVVRRLGEVAPLQRGFDLPSKEIKEGDYPVVYSNGIGNYHNRSQAKASGIVTGRSGTIGKVTFIEQDYWPHNTALWVTDFKGNYPKYIFYLFLNIKLEQFATGSGVPTLNRNDIHEFSVSMPPFETQTRIATILSDMDAEIATLETKLIKAQRLKQGMMQQLLIGKIRLV